MTERKARRITGKLSKAVQQRLEKSRKLVAEELPELITKTRLYQDAGEEETLSGQVRRAIHASPLDLVLMAEKTGISPVWLDEFLTGERTLRSDVLDRLARVLGFAVRERGRKSRTAMIRKKVS